MNKTVARSAATLSLLVFTASFPGLAVAQVAVVGRPTSTTTTHPDGSKEVVTPDGKHSFYNADGSPRGINRTCSSSGMGPVKCSYWGSNSYGGKN
jgi:hypothetical protein